MINTEIAIIVPVHNAEAYVSRFLDTLKAQHYDEYQLIVVDDGSEDETSSILSEKMPEAHVLKGDGNLWWTKSVCVGIDYALNNFNFSNILLINIDLEFTQDYLYKIVEAQKSSNSRSIIGSAINDIRNGNRVDYGWKLNYWTTKATNHSKFENLPELIEVDFLSGRGMLIPKEILSSVHFDSKLFPQYFADTVFSAKAKKKGFKIYVSSIAVLNSHVEETGLVKMKQERSISSLKRYLFHFSSPGNINKSIAAYRRIVPIPQVLTFLPLYIFKTLILYFKN